MYYVVYYINRARKSNVQHCNTNPAASRRGPEGPSGNASAFKEEGSWLGIGVEEHRQGPLGDDNYDVSLCISLFGDRVALEGH